MRISLDKHLENFVATSYSMFCHLGEEDLRRKVLLQQAAVPTQAGKLVVNFGIYGGYLASCASLINRADFEHQAGQVPVTYGLVVRALPVFQVQETEKDPERIALRRTILESMWDALGSAVVGLERDYLDVQEEIVRKSPMKVITHPEDLPEGLKLIKEVDDVLDLIAEMSLNPTEELVGTLERLVIFVEGRRAKIYSTGSEAA